MNPRKAAQWPTIGAVAFVLCVGVFARASQLTPIPTPTPEKNLSEPVTTGADSLTTDKNNWRIVRRGSLMYADEDVYQKIRQYGSDDHNSDVSRLKWENRFGRALRAVKAELLQEHGPHDLCKVRYFSRIQGRTLDWWVAESDIIPFDQNLWNKSRLESENDEELQRIKLLYDHLKQLEGNPVRIREGALVLSEDKFWEFAAFLRKVDDSRAIKKATEWVKASEGQGNSILAMLAGENSFGVVTAINSPFLMFVQIESNVDGRRAIFWVTASDVRLESDAATPRALHRFMKLESVKINGVSINAVPRSREIKRVAMDGVVKDAVQRIVANVKMSQSMDGVQSFLHPKLAATDLAKSDDEANNGNDFPDVQPTAQPESKPQATPLSDQQNFRVHFNESSSSAITLTN